MTRWLLLLFAFAASSPAAAMIALPKAAPPQWHIEVKATVDGKRLSYKTVAWVYTPGPSYRMKLYTVGPYYNGTVTDHVAAVADIIAKEPQAAVFNAGYWDGYPFVPAGLVVENGRTFHGFDFSKTAGGDYSQSAVVCLNGSGQIKLRHTSDYLSTASSIKRDCTSSLQAGPFVVENGENGMRHLQDRDFAIRTILGLDAHHVPTLVIFQSPIHLLVAAEFLRAKSGATRNVVIETDSTGLKSSGGLGLVDAINLNGAAGVVCYFKGQRIAGDSALALPSAFSLQPK